MIWTILLTLALSIVGLILLLFSLILFPPVYAGAVFNYSKERKTIRFNCWWMHPWIAKFNFDPLQNCITVFVLGHKLIQRSIKSENDEVEDKKESKESKDDLITIKSESFEKSASDQKKVQKKIEPLIVLETEKEWVSELKEDKGHVPESDYKTVAIENETQERIANINIINDEEPVYEKKEEMRAEPAIAKEDKQTSEKTKDNFFKKLKRNRYFFIAKNGKWRNKIFRWLFRLVMRFFKILTFDRLVISIRAGVEEPALLGKIYGFYEMARYGLQINRGYHSFRFEPVFMKYHFEGNGSFGIRISVIHLLFPFLVAIATFPYFTTLLLFWKSRKLKAN